MGSLFYSQSYPPWDLFVYFILFTCVCACACACEHACWCHRQLLVLGIGLQQEQQAALPLSHLSSLLYTSLP